MNGDWWENSCLKKRRQRRIETHQPQGRNYRITALSALPLFARDRWQIHRSASDKSEFLLSVDNVSLAICPTNPTRQFRWSVICYLHGLHLSREKLLSTNTNENIYTNTNLYKYFICSLHGLHLPGSCRQRRNFGFQRETTTSAMVLLEGRQYSEYKHF